MVHADEALFALENPLAHEVRGLGAKEAHGGENLRHGDKVFLPALSAAEDLLRDDLLQLGRRGLVFIQVVQKPQEKRPPAVIFLPQQAAEAEVPVRAVKKAQARPAGWQQVALLSTVTEKRPPQKRRLLQFRADSVPVKKQLDSAQAAQKQVILLPACHGYRG